VDRLKADVALKDAQSKLKGASGSLFAGVKELDSLRAQLKLHTLSSPIGGRVGRAQVVRGQTLTVGTPVAEVIDLDDSIDFISYVPPGQIGKLKVGQPVPDGELLTLRGEHLSISSLQGKTSLLEFGATWCAPCRSMLKPLRELADKSGPATQIVSVDVGESQADVTAHYARRDTGNLRIALDPSGSVAQLLGVEAFPTLVLLDARGRVQLINVGAVRDMAPIAQRIESLQP